MPEEPPEPSPSPAEDEPTLPHIQQGGGEGLNPSAASPPGSAWVPPTPAELDAEMPAFEVRQLLGCGGMGAVYRAVQKSLNRSVAIKLLPPEVAVDPAFAERFKREAYALAELNHPNIVHIHDFGETDAGHYYFVMEFVDGCDFHELIRAGELDPEKTLNAVSQICDALAYAHGKGYIHRDIKPANIFLNEEGQVKVGDFGLAKLIDGEEDGHPVSDPLLTMTGTTVGTPQYLAPEAVSGEVHVDQRADIYSLGVMFYEMLTGQVPRGAFEPPSKKVEIDVRLDEVVLKAMADSPERRYQSAVEVQTDVDAIRSGDGTKAESPKVRRKGVLGVVGIGVALAIGATLYPWKGEESGEETVDPPEEKPSWVGTTSDPATYGLPAFHGELRPIPGTAGWRSEEPGEVVVFPAMPGQGEVPDWAVVPDGLDDAVALYSVNVGGSAAIFAIRANGTVEVWGETDKEVIRTVPRALLQDVAALAIGSYSGFALHRDGQITGWGGPSEKGKIKTLQESITDPVIAVQVAQGRVFALQAGGKLIEVPRPEDQGWVPAPVNDRSLIGMVRDVNDYNAILGLRQDGSLISWGEKTNQGTGARRIMAFPPGDLGPFRVIAGGASAILEDGTAGVWRKTGEWFPFARKASALAVGWSNAVAAARLPDRKWEFRLAKGDSEYCTRMARGCTQLIYVKPYPEETGVFLGIRPPLPEPPSSKSEKTGGSPEP